MSTSKLALRSKSFEASDLQNTVPTASANRFVAQGYRVRLPNGSYSATPSTGRISSRSEGRRVGKARVSTCRSRWSPYQSNKQHSRTQVITGQNTGNTRDKNRKNKEVQSDRL